MTSSTEAKSQVNHGLLLPVLLVGGVVLILGTIWSSMNRSHDAANLELLEAAATEIHERVDSQLRTEALVLGDFARSINDGRASRGQIAQLRTQLLLDRDVLRGICLVDVAGEVVWSEGKDRQSVHRDLELLVTKSGEVRSSETSPWSEPLELATGSFLIVYNMPVDQETAVHGIVDLTELIRESTPVHARDDLTTEIWAKKSDFDQAQRSGARPSRLILLELGSHSPCILVESSASGAGWQANLLFIIGSILAFALALALWRERISRHRLEQTATENDDQFSVFARVSLVGIFHSDAQGGCTYVNDRWTQMTGLSLEEAQGEGWARSLHPEDRERVAAEWTVAARDGVRFDSRYRFVTPSGTVTWVAGKAAAIRDAEGACSGYFGSVTDITEGKLNELRLGSLFEGAPVSLSLEDFSGVKCQIDQLRSEGVSDFVEFFRENPDKARECAAMVKIMDVNRTSLELYGAENKAELLQALEACFVDDFFEAFSAQLTALAGGATRLSHDARVKTLDGKWRDVVINMLIAPDSPDWSYVYVAIIDLTDRKRAEEALARSEAFLSDTGRMARVGGWEVDAKTKELRWTEETFRIFELPAGATPSFEEAVQFFDGEDQSKFVQGIDQAIGDGASFDLELILKTAKNRTRWVHLICRPEFEDAIVTHLNGTIQDVSERIASEAERISLERQVQHGQKLESLGVLAGGIAHDFNNILMAILGHTDIALGRVGPDSAVYNNLEAIENATQRAADLAQQMLAYSGKGKFSIRPIYLNEVINEMVQILSVSISKKVDLSLDLADILPTFSGDATQIRQVIMNLVTNSAEAIGDVTGELIVSTGTMSCTQEYIQATEPQAQLEEKDRRQAGLYCFLEVKDNGIGMDGATIQRLFEPFFTTKFTGRGLGMAAVLGIVRGHGGGVQVVSSPGIGTSVMVLFPASSASDRKDVDLVRALPADKANLEGAHVLFADDEYVVRDVGRTMLRNLGLSVTLAKDGVDAVALFREDPSRFDFVLLDLTMPKMDGAQVFDEMKELDPEAKIILVSGYCEQDATANFGDRGLAGFLQKPFRMVDLRAALVQATVVQAPQSTRRPSSP
ncbi:MAG: PAS domain S-box-containing protein [Planctomycetota bacterium]|jgi:PAS domain S-box-containing protein